MQTETITWYTPAERLPDADLTVLVRMPEGWDEPVTQGYLDGDRWRDADGSPIVTPALWAELPTGDGTAGVVAAPVPSIPGTELPNFDEVWKQDYEWDGKRGYRYGRDALEQVRFGYGIARCVLIENSRAPGVGGPDHG